MIECVRVHIFIAGVLRLRDLATHARKTKYDWNTSRIFSRMKNQYASVILLVRSVFYAFRAFVCVCSAANR